MGKAFGDGTRRAKAKEENGRMCGPWETDHCKHGRLYSFRWTWPIGSDVESGDIEIGRNGCTKCENES